MTFTDFDKNHVEVLKTAIDNLTNIKGKEYAHDADRFANFKRLADQLYIPADKILWVYFTKHLDSIINYLQLTPEERANTKLSEPIQGRIHDAIMYLILLDGLWEDLKINKCDSFEVTRKTSQFFIDKQYYNIQIPGRYCTIIKIDQPIGTVEYEDSFDKTRHQVQQIDFFRNWR